MQPLCRSSSIVFFCQTSRSCAPRGTLNRETGSGRYLSKPVISLSYHRKMDVAMRGVGQGRFCADIESFRVDWLIGAFRSLVDESKTIKLDSAAAVEANAAALSQQFDSLFLPNKS